MSAEDRQHRRKTTGASAAPSLAAVPFLEKKLDELYDALGDAPRADALVEAKISLQAGDYSKALQLVEGVRDWCTWLRGLPKITAVGIAGRAAKAISSEVMSGFATMVRLLKPLSDWHLQQMEADEAASAGQAGASRNAADEPDRGALLGSAKSMEDLTKQYASPMLERRFFLQLYKSAHQSGLVPNADMIKVVCDREVFDGRYQRAFEIIEAMYVQFNAQAAQRATDLRRETVRYKAGKLKMSVKDWLERQRRVMDQNQDIERAHLYFTRVLDALRVVRLLKKSE